MPPENADETSATARLTKETRIVIELFLGYAEVHRVYVDHAVAMLQHMDLRLFLSRQDVERLPP